MRSFFGLCQQVGTFSPKIAAALAPLSPLLKKSIAWEWTPSHDEAFRAARTELAIVPELAFYDPNRPTALHTDASLLNGLGFILKQCGADNKWHMVQAGSRFLRRTESRYAMIELQFLAASWAMLQCRQFLEGLPTFELITDHRPLVPILNDYALDKLENLRLLRIRLKMSLYLFTTRWVPGKQNIRSGCALPRPCQPWQRRRRAGGRPTSIYRTGCSCWRHLWIFPVNSGHGPKFGESSRGSRPSLHRLAPSRS